jgi:uncharacterized protein (UPF0276 family)
MRSVEESAIRLQEIGRFIGEIETLIEVARRFGLEVAAYLLALAAAEIRETHIMGQYLEASPNSRRTRR